MLKQLNKSGVTPILFSRKCPNCHADLGKVFRKEKFFDSHGKEIKLYDIKKLINPLDFSSLSIIFDKSVVCECHQCEYRWSLYKHREESIPTESSAQKSPTTESNYKVCLTSDTEKIQATTEDIRVPSGVTIKVQRSRTIEHTISIDWRVLGGMEVDAGLEHILSVSIRGEIERTEGHTYQQSETQGYEIDLSGDRSDQYRLIWTDVWRKGLVELQNGNETTMLPFRFRERTELDVVSVIT